MLFSVLYHLFGCISSSVCADFLKLDYCGIGLGILGCYLCGLHISFECYRNWRIRYEIMIIFIMFIAVIYYIYSVKRYIRRNIHVTLFIAISLLGLLPGFHWYYLHGGWTNKFVQHFFPKLFILYGILGFGTFAYLLKFPERFFPGIKTLQTKKKEKIFIYLFRLF
jgi:predicted membrane channel-forming protein YqfA (hemolysin III family)